MALKAHALGFVVGAAVGAGGCYVYIKHVKKLQSGTTQDISHHALELGLPRTESLRFNQGYVVAFDYRTKNPKWVLEHITEETANGSGQRKDSHFAEDPDIEPWLRSRLADYRNSGYDRGHMAPAANHKGNQKAMDETFCLSNISPQVGEGFNRDYWARFEKFVKDLTRKSQDVYVLTGPLFMPNLTDDGKWQMKYNLIGQPPSLVSVPTHYFKVVVAKGLGNRPEPNEAQQQPSAKAEMGVAAFVMPNAPIDPKTPLSAFVVPLEPLESVAGTRFFPTFLSQDRMQSLDAAAQHVRLEGLASMKVLDRQQLLEAVHPHLALPAPQGVQDNPAGTMTAQAPLAAATTGAQVVVAGGGGGGGGGGEMVTRPKPAVRAHRGCAHLCEVLACRLPPERFWEGPGGVSGGGASKGRRDSGSSGGGGNSRALTRR